MKTLTRSTRQAARSRGYRAGLGTVLLYASFTAAGASFEERGKSFCYELEKKLNALVDYTRTACIPTKGTGEQHSFIVISEQPVFSVDASKKGWVIGIVGVAGQLMNQDSSLKVDQLVLSDANQMKQRTAYAMVNGRSQASVNSGVTTGAIARLAS